MSNLTQQSVVPEGYKLTEVGVIPEDWEVMTLSDITQAKRPISYGIVQTGPLVYGGVRCLRVVDISNGNISKDNLITTTTEISNSYRRTQLQLNDLVIPLRGKVGEVGLIDADLVGDNLTRGVALIALARGYSPPFIKQAISFEESAKRLENSMNGSALQEISIAALRSFKISIPVESEQNAIANTLSDVDTLITSLEKLISKKRVIKAASMQQLLTGKKRLPPFDKSHTGYKQTELGEVPEDWEIVAVGSLVAFNNGVAHENVISEYGSYTVVNSKFISTEGSVAKYSDQLLCSPKKGNVLMVMSDIPNGRAIAKCFVVDEDKKYTVNQRICSMEPLGIESKFLFYVLNRNKFYLQFDDGVKQTNLRKQDVLECPLQLPSLREQVLISTALTEMDQDITTLEKKLIKTQQLKQGMMQELLTGKTRLLAGEV